MCTASEESWELLLHGQFPPAAYVKIAFEEMERLPYLENFTVKATLSGKKKERQNEEFWCPRRGHKHCPKGLLQLPQRKRCFENQHKDPLFSDIFLKETQLGQNLRILFTTSTYCSKKSLTFLYLYRAEKTC